MINEQYNELYEQVSSGKTENLLVPNAVIIRNASGTVDCKHDRLLAGGSDTCQEALDLSQGSFNGIKEDGSMAGIMRRSKLHQSVIKYAFNEYQFYREAKLTLEDQGDRISLDNFSEISSAAVLFTKKAFARLPSKVDNVEDLICVIFGINMKNKNMKVHRDNDQTLINAYLLRELKGR